MSFDLAVLIASPGPLAGVIGVLGVLAAAAWVGWRFGPTLTRLTGWCSWVLAWACGSQGGYGYCVAFLLFGVGAWGGGTISGTRGVAVAGPRHSRPNGAAMPPPRRRVKPV
jgi:hypothetical protein